MIPNSCIKIETTKFPVLDGEKEEIVNENMYGKAVCNYLEKELPKENIEVPFYCNEDWGWWLEVKSNNFSMGLCIYSDPDVTDSPESYAIMPSEHNAKKWYWSKFKTLDISKDVLLVMEIVANIFKKDKEILKVSQHNDFPY